MNVDELISKLQALRSESRLGGDTVVVLCLPNIEYAPVSSVDLDRLDPDGATISIESTPEVVKRLEDALL